MRYTAYSAQRAKQLRLSDTFTNLSAKTETERSRIAEQVAQLEQSSKETKARMGDIQNWMRLVKENAVVVDIDRNLIDALIERVEIGESAVENGVKVQDVRVVYKFVGVV